MYIATDMRTQSFGDFPDCIEYLMKHLNHGFHPALRTYAVLLSIPGAFRFFIKLLAKSFLDVTMTFTNVLGESLYILSQTRWIDLSKNIAVFY